ncbi:MAG: YfhO family protein [Olegusella sp.]|nr:YfhO family protein [Olegusella sp.]
MHLRHYLYLAAVLMCALVVVAIAIQKSDELTRPTSRRSKLEMFLTVTILALGITAILRNQIMGLGKTTVAYRVSASDTYDQYIPYYLSLIRSIREGGFPLWMSSYGLGTSILANQMSSFDPFNIVLIPLCLIFGDGFLGRALAITFACRAMASGLLASRLLKRYCQTPLARIFGSAAFGLGGYLFTEGKHYFFGSAWVYMVFLMVALEWLMADRRGKSFALVSVVTALLTCFSPYAAFMVLVAIPIYVALRLLVNCDGKGAKEYGRSLGICALAVFGGLLLAGILLVPSAYYTVFETARVTSSKAGSHRSVLKMLFSILPLRSIKLLFSRMLGNALVESGTRYTYLELGGLNELEFFQGGLSCGVFILLGQFFHWAFTEGTRKQKIAIGIGTALVAFYCLDYFLPSLLTVFRYPTYRGCLVVDALIICAMNTAVEKRFIERSPALAPLIATFALTALVLAWAWLHTVNGRIDCAVYAIALIALVLTSLVFVRKPQLAGTLSVLMCAVLVATVTADSFCEINLNQKHVSPKNMPLAGLSDTGLETQEALAYLDGIEGKDAYYRVERTFTSYNAWNDALVFGYRGITSYNSSEDGDLSAFFHDLWPEAIKKETNNFACYSYAINADNPQMMSLTGIRYVITREPLDYDWATLLTTTEHGAYVYKVSYSDSEISPLYLRTIVMPEGDLAAMSLDERRAQLDDMLVVDDEHALDIDLQSGDPVESEVTIDEQPDGSLKGTVNSSADSVACLTVPCTADWIVSVDGKEVPTFRANLAFVGFELPAGNHIIEAHYRPAGLLIGAVVSAAGIALTAFGIWLSSRMKGDAALADHAPRHAA